MQSLGWVLLQGGSVITESGCGDRYAVGDGVETQVTRVTRLQAQDGQGTCQQGLR